MLNSQGQRPFVDFWIFHDYFITKFEFEVYINFYENKSKRYIKIRRKMKCIPYFC